MSWIVDDAIKQRNIERVRKLVDLVGYDRGVKRERNHSILEWTPDEELRGMIVHELGYESDMKVEAKLEEKYGMEIVVSGGFDSDQVLMKPRKPIMFQNLLPIAYYLDDLKNSGYLLTFKGSEDEKEAMDQVVGEEKRYEKFLDGWYIAIDNPDKKSLVSIETEFSHLEKEEYVKDPRSTIRVIDSYKKDPKTKEILDNIAVHVLGLKNPYDNKIEQ